jgi:hypothetical protein
MIPLDIASVRDITSSKFVTSPETVSTIPLRMAITNDMGDCAFVAEDMMVNKSWFFLVLSFAMHLSFISVLRHTIKFMYGYVDRGN